MTMTLNQIHTAAIINTVACEGIKLNLAKYPKKWNRINSTMFSFTYSSGGNGMRYEDKCDGTHCINSWRRPALDTLRSMNCLVNM